MGEKEVPDQPTGICDGEPFNTVEDECEMRIKSSILCRASNKFYCLCVEDWMQAPGDGNHLHSSGLFRFPGASDN